ncbi:hypothetical protein [Plantactinospora mayteni]|nr:hypothetical protein [Plantactinospora mayteni]
MFEKLEMLGDRLLSKFVPTTSAAASCPCGPYPYTGPCYYYPSCGGGLHRDCYCANSAQIIECTGCH